MFTVGLRTAPNLGRLTAFGNLHRRPNPCPAAHRTVVLAMAKQGRIIRDAPEAYKIAASAKTVAVLGCKTEAQAGQPAFFVPEYLQSSGMDIIPVPVYYPEVKEIMGKPVVRDLKEIKQPVDILDVFRRPQDLPAHVPDILQLKPKVVWLQSGISNPEVEKELADAGIDVVVSRCLKVDRAAAGARSAM